MTVHQIGTFPESLPLRARDAHLDQQCCSWTQSISSSGKRLFFLTNHSHIDPGESRTDQEKVGLVVSKKIETPLLLSTG